MCVCKMFSRIAPVAPLIDIGTLARQPCLQAMSLNGCAMPRCRENRENPYRVEEVS